MSQPRLLSCISQHSAAIVTARKCRVSIPRPQPSSSHLRSRPLATAAMAGVPSLPTLPDITRLSPRVIRILGDNPSKFTLQGTNTYLLGQGRSRILLDTAEGRPKWKQTLSQVLTDENATITQVLLTHWHPDHIGGVSDVLSLCPQATVYKSPLRRVAELDSLTTIHEISHEQSFSTHGLSLRAIHTPGHTVDHMAFVLAEEDALFTGDNVLGHGTAVFEDLGAYMASLALMKDLVTGRAYPSHGEVVDKSRTKIEEYISHRRQREEQILVAMGGIGGEAIGSTGDGPRAWSAMEIVKVVYKDYPESLHVPAQGGVLQILRKLEAEGRVRNVNGERYAAVTKSPL